MRDLNCNTKANDPVVNNGVMTESHTPGAIQPHDVATRGFADKFGIHPMAAVATVAVDTMLFCGDIATAGFIIPLTVAVAFGLGIVTFMAQKKWYGDDNESAFIKAFIVAGLTAIPTSLPGFLCIPAGIVGLFGGKES